MDAAFTILAASLPALAVILAAAVLAWVASLMVGKVSFVDSLWPLFFLVAAGTFLALGDSPGTRAILVTALLAIWALRLSAHIARRNFGEPEDRRYQALRDRHTPFAVKSLYIVFGLQGFLAWLVALPLAAVILGPDESLNAFDAAAVALWLAGMVFEVGGDWQLTRFKQAPGSEGKVLDSGLWRYTRHPNYFGEFCIWWAFYLFAVAAGGWWTMISPLLMTVLLLRVSGVTLLERDIAERRPGYADYVRRTNAFFPGPPQARGAGGASA